MNGIFNFFFKEIKTNSDNQKILIILFLNLLFLQESLMSLFSTEDQHKIKIEFAYYLIISLLNTYVLINFNEKGVSTKF